MLIIVPVPLVVVWILHITHIMSERVRAIMVYDASKSVLCSNVVFIEEIFILHIFDQIQIIQRKLHFRIQFGPRLANFPEPLELYSQHWRRPAHRKRLLMLRFKPTFLTHLLPQQLLCFMKVRQHLAQTNNSVFIFVSNLVN